MKLLLFILPLLLTTPALGCYNDTFAHQAETEFRAQCATENSTSEPVHTIPIHALGAFTLMGGGILIGIAGTVARRKRRATASG